MNDDQNNSCVMLDRALTMKVLCSGLLLNCFPHKLYSGSIEMRKTASSTAAATVQKVFN
jgi:hypothetical protein